ncbi:MAG: sigma-70 family RNA polymerase sigma factor, partial [Thermomicrobiales bacterium]
PRYRPRSGRGRGRESGSFRSWLFAIAHNVAMDTHRRKRPLPLADGWEGIDADPLPDERAISMEASQQLHAAIVDLTADQQAVMHLRMAGLTGVEIAEVLNRTPQAVKSIQFRAISQLRKILGNEEEERDARHAERTR